MSKVTDEQTQLSDRDWWQEAGNHLNLELHGWTFRNNASFIDRETRQYVPLTGAIAARLIALEAASSTPDGEEDSRTWFELREPGCVPERKGPMPPTMVAGFLRELFEHRPQAYVTVITMGQDGPLLQDGPECLQMIDGRSMNVGRRAIENQRAAHGAHPAPISKGVTVKLVWSADGVAETPFWDYFISPHIDGHFRLATTGVPSSKWTEHPTLEALEAAAQADFDARVLSCLSHNAGEIEAGGEVDELQQSVSALEEERQSLIATKREQIGRLTARADAADKRIAELKEALSKLETAATLVQRLGAQTGSHWTVLGSSLLGARAALKESRL